MSHYISKKKTMGMDSHQKPTLSHQKPTPSHQKPTPLGNSVQENDTAHIEMFFNTVKKGNLNDTKEILREKPELLRETCHLFSNKTALHIAALAGHVDIAEYLIQSMKPEHLELKGSKDGFTALADATINGVTRIAKCMVEKNPRVVSIPTKSGMIPAVLAVAYDNKDMALYLYKATPLKEFSPDNGQNRAGASFLTYAIRMQQFDIAFDLVKQYPRLAFASDHRDRSPLFELAGTPSAFLKGTQLRFWQHWVYKYCIGVQQNEVAKISREEDEQANNDLCLDVPDVQDSQIIKRNRTCSGILHLLASKLLQVIGINKIYEMKLVHHRSTQLLVIMCEEMKTLDDDQMVEVLRQALWEAAACGNEEFFTTVLKKFPELVWYTNDKGSTIFMHAIELRQPKIFSLIHGFASKKAMTVETDKSGNNMLHMAGLLAPSSQLNSIQGAALQMQRELQWFKEVEKMMSLDRLEKKNKRSKTPRQSFTENHSMLMKAAEDWMKSTATSCTVAGALIVTVMFAVAFTAPGGNSQDGYPLFLGKILFKVFIVSDAISLFSSIASVLIFLGILTSRYAEEDFLKALPTKMMIGLSTLFLSLATMTIAFCAALLIMLHREPWVKYSIIVLACLPTILFIWMQFPLLFDMFVSTYGRRIFYTKVERWLIS